MKLLKSSIIVGLYSFLSKITGLIREVFIADALAIGIVADCFNVAFKLPNFFRKFFAEGALNSAFIPIYSNKLSDESRDKLNNFSDQIFTILTTILLVFICLSEIFMPKIVSLLAPGFAETSKHYFELAVTFSRISMPYLFFISLASLYGGILNSHGKFSANAFMPVLLNIVVILSLILAKNDIENKAKSLTYGIFFAGITQYIFMFFSLKRHYFLPKLVLPKLSFDVKKMFKNMGPAILSSSLSQLNLVVDTIVASNITGAISSLYYADRIIGLPISLIGTTTSVILLPELAKYSNKEKNLQSHSIQEQSFKLLSFIIFPISAMLLALSQEIVHIIYERGSFNHEDGLKVAKIIFISAFSVPAYVLSRIFISSFFAQEDTKTPLKISMLTVFLNVVLDILLVKNYGALGVAFASTLSGIIGFFVYSIVCFQKNIFIYNKQLYIFLFKVTIASFFAYIFAFYAAKNFHNLLYHQKSLIKLTNFAILSFFSVLIYIIVASFLGLLNINYIRNLKFGRGR